MNASDLHEERHPVEVIAEEYSARMRAGERPTVEEYASRYPEHAELIRTVLPSIAMVERVSISDEQHRKASNSQQHTTYGAGSPQTLGDFDIVREIGRGGMGVVYEAIQRSLNRRVALKVISGLISGNSKHAARFRREAESAASLHHTNIVPIFGIGDEQGTQYYAMQLIEGVTLHDVIETLRNNFLDATRCGQAARRMLDKTSTELIAPYVSDKSASRSVSESKRRASQTETAALDTCSANRTANVAQSEIETQAGELLSKPTELTRVYFRNVAKTIANVANALSYAHHQRVLHRDIKPANLLLDREGTVWITDFGLARRTDLDAETQSGEILGTLRYMAPEQLAGSGDSRVDIYSLGLTLFEMLTLKPAIDSPKLRLLDPERNSVVRHPRSIVPNIPKDLETITLKACAYAPGDRYQHARDLEEDLRRFLEDRPILAKRSSPIESLVRWARRNPAIATLTSATLGLLVLIASLLAVWNRQQQRSIREIGDQRQRAESNLAAKTEALTKVELEHARAEKNLTLAMRAFDQITSNIASRGNAYSFNSDLEDEELSEFADATLSQADVALLESLLAFFDQFSEENAKDLRIESAIGRQRVADIQHRLGQLDQAEVSYQKAMDAFRSILQQKPDQPEIVLPMMAIHTERIVLFAKRGQLVKAARELDDARQLLKLSPAVASSSDGRFALAKLLTGVGNVGARLGEDPRARVNRPALGKLLGNNDLKDPKVRLKREGELNAEALALLKELTVESPENESYQVFLGRSLRDESRIARLMEDKTRADEALRRAIELFESLCKSHPDSAAFKFELADTLGKSVAIRTLDQQRCTRALSLCEEISKENPHVPEYKALKASTLVKLGMMAGRNTKGEELLSEAITIQRELNNRYPDIAVYTVGLLQSLKRLAELQLQLGKPEKAKENEELAEKEIQRMRKNYKLPRFLGPK